MTAPATTYAANLRIWRGDAGGGGFVDYWVEAEPEEVIGDRNRRRHHLLLRPSRIAAGLARGRRRGLGRRGLERPERAPRRAMRLRPGSPRAPSTLLVE